MNNLLQKILSNPGYWFGDHQCSHCAGAAAVDPSDPFSRELTRRQFFARSAKGIGVIALASLLQPRATASVAVANQESAIETALPHFAPKAKRVIYLFQSGAPSQLDLFDPKPRLVEMTGQPMPESLTKGNRVAQLQGQQLICVGTKFTFAQHGKCGAVLSELLPHTARIVDDICIIRSMHTDPINHDPAVTFLQTGNQQPGRPVMGSWLSYGLGSENQSLPAFVVLLSGSGGQPLLSRYWHNGFLPSSHQGVQFRSDGVLYVKNPEGISGEVRRQLLDGIRELNQINHDATGDPEVSARIAQYELAYRMQTSVPELMDISNESPQTLELYGAEPGKSSFANNCLLARRLAERGVRFIQLYHRDWDHHGGLPAGITDQCRQTDKASAALIIDLKQRGLLDDTLVIWGGEFGRTPMNQGNMSNGDYGRDHHNKCYTLWMAGGGIKGGITIGKTDDLGYDIVEDPIHVHDFQATILHCLGINHELFTYRTQGRDFRLTDVRGTVVKQILA